MDASFNSLPHSLLVLAGAGACAVVVASTAWSAVDHHRRRQARREETLAGRRMFHQRVLAVAERARARRDTALAWEGLRELRVSAIVDECQDVKSFYLAATDGRPLPDYLPGQYLTVHLPPTPGVRNASDKPVVRCYSLSDRPREEFYRLTVKHCPPPASQAGAPPGVGSTILHQHVQVGHMLQVAAPRGEFFLSPQQPDPVVLIGAGIGVTPIISMLNAQSHADSTRETYVLLGMRNSGEHPFKLQLDELAGAQTNIHPFVAYSQPTTHDAEFHDFHHRGHVDMDYIRQVLPSSNFRFYLCGPPAMMESLVPGLLDWGVPDERIHFEAFGPASINRDGVTTAAKSAIGAKVSFVRSGVVAEWSEADTTLLGLAERHGVPLDAGCRVGNCGACAIKVIDGDVAAVKTPGMQPMAGECLTCVNVPKGELVLDA